MKYADNSIGPQVQQNARKSKTTDSTANRNCFIVIPPLLYLHCYTSVSPVRKYRHMKCLSHSGK